MKTLRLSAVLLLLGTLTLGMAETTVDAQITAIQNAATDEERVELVNEFKTTLSTLSDEERTAAIDELKTTMQADGTALQTQTQMQTRTQQRSRINQTDEAQTLDATQAMGQGQSAAKAMQSAPSENAGAMGGFRGGR